MEGPEVDGVDFCEVGGRPRPRGVDSCGSIAVVDIDVGSVVSMKEEF